MKPKNTHGGRRRGMRGWTSSEQEALCILAPFGGPACALMFDRSPDSIRHKAAQLGVSLRRKTLGTPLVHTSPAVLRRVRELSDALLCPACGFHFVAIKATGLCSRCHFQRLVEVHEEEIAKIDGQRQLWSARSRLQRRRRSLAAAEAVSVAETRDVGRTMEGKSSQTNEVGRVAAGDNER